MILLVFDFDGVLAIPYTNPEEYYPQIPDIIKSLHTKYILCVSSFNPRAKLVLEKWNLLQYFSAIRCGSNNNWDTYDESFRINMSKSLQIKNMILEVGISFDEIYFYDDDIDNINEVSENFKEVKITSILIDNKEGLISKNIS